MTDEPCRIRYDTFVIGREARTRIACLTHELTAWSNVSARSARALLYAQAQRRMFDAHLRCGVETKAYNVDVVEENTHQGSQAQALALSLAHTFYGKRKTKMEHNVREGAVFWIGVEAGVQPELFAEERDALAWLGDDRPSPTVGGAYVAPGDRRRLWEVTLRGVKEMEVVPAQLAVRKPR